MAEHNQSKFAKLAGVSRNAICKAIKQKTILKNKNDKIDDRHPLAMKYLRLQLEKSKQSTVKEKVKSKVNKIKNKKPIKKNEKTLPSDNKGGGKNNKPKENEIDFIGDEMTQQYFDKEEIDIEYKKANTEKIKISNAEKLRLLVPVEFVIKKFGKLSAVIINYFFPMGGRLAPIVCGLCKVTDPKIIKKVETVLNNEITRALSEFKKTASEEVDE